jgi:hypothetical protein
MSDEIKERSGDMPLIPILVLFGGLGLMLALLLSGIPKAARPSGRSRGRRKL